MGAKYCDGRVCLSVCLSARIYSKTTCPNFTKFSVRVLPVAVARSSYNDSAIRYVFPVLWTTSCLPIMGHMARYIHKTTHHGAASAVKSWRLWSLRFPCLRLLLNISVERGKVASHTLLWFCVEFERLKQFITSRGLHPCTQSARTYWWMSAVNNKKTLKIIQDSSIIRQHRSTYTHVDAAYCYIQSIMVCLSVCRSVWHDGVHVGATWRIRLNRPCATAMRPFWRITLTTC